ncbi:YwhD family protein [Bacillus carboniphilus]|uniref:YwhD family protein n=1 Tax=Bacillus carboniphilus TaxID=86663 RepID=A0ABN0WK03_9BACI
MDKNEKKPIQFNIIKSDPTDGHKGFKMGAFSLDNVSPVIIDVEEKTASVEIGAMHARSPVEKGIKFLKDKSEVPNGKQYWLVWVTIDRKEEGLYFRGVTACEMTVDRSIRRGYKSLPDHVNKMDKSLKGHIMVNHMDEESKSVLGNFLKSHDPEMWDRSEEKLKKDLNME